MKTPGEILPMTPKQRTRFTQIYDEYRVFLYYIAIQHTTDYQDLDDIVQDAWCRLMKQAGTIVDLEPPALRSYICRAVETACIDNHERKHLEHPQVSFEDNMFDMERSQWDMTKNLYLHEQMEKLQKGLQKRDWLVLVWKYFYMFSDREIAARIGVEPGSVRTLTGRARDKGKHILDGWSLIGGGGNER